jgi:hypothetical protein
MSSNSDPNSTSPIPIPTLSSLSDADNELLFVFGRTVTQDAVELIWEKLFVSE